MPTSDRRRIPPAVQRLVAARYPGARVERLSGDASTRSYFRVHPAPVAPSAPEASTAVSPPESVVIALHPRPFDIADFAFLQTTALLEEIGVPVPRVRHHDGPAGLLVLDDLGDRLLQAEVTGRGEPGRPRVVATPARVDRWYGDAVGFIVLLQQDGTPKVDDRLGRGRDALDGARFRRELGFFVEHLIDGLAGAAVAPAGRRDVEASFDVLCELLDLERRVLCHRDLHSRNLLVTAAGRLVVVDHQDAMMGPDTYDLASLLRDPYVPVPEKRVAAMLGRYLALAGADEELDSLQARFDRMAVQRLLKACGTFASQKMLRNNDSYLEYIGPALARALAAMERCEEMEPLRRALAPLAARFPDGSR